MKISSYPYGLSESYEVKYWYKGTDGYVVQDTEVIYCSSKDKHKQVEEYFLKNFASMLDSVDIISVTYM